MSANREDYREWVEEGPCPECAAYSAHPYGHRDRLCEFYERAAQGSTVPARPIRYHKHLVECLGVPFLAEEAAS